ISISDFKFIGNTNMNKLDCGSIHFSNDLNISISNSEFSNNYSKSDGGAICISNIKDMNLDLFSNTFKKNYGINGGAIYLTNAEASYDNNKKKHSPRNINENVIKFENNTFIENEAENFGGAVYSNYNKLFLATSKNNEIIKNKAGIMGGGIYTPNSKDQNMFNVMDIKNWKFENNTVNSFINDFTTKPYYISLNTTLKNNRITITSGNFFSLKFLLLDEYNNIINDITKYYSSLTLKLSLSSPDNKNGDNVNFYLTKNIGTFINGVCELNNVKVIANASLYILKISIENYYEEIKFDFPDIEVMVNYCSKHQIAIYDNNNILRCENALCKPECNKENGICYPSEDNLKNDPYKNNCQCNAGYQGKVCDDKIVVDFSKLKLIILIGTIPIVVIVSLFILFLIIYRNENIIKDTGLKQNLQFSFGIIIYFISNLFVTYMDFNGCAINFFLKHVGIITILTVCYENLVINYRLGYKKKNEEKFKFLKDELENVDGECVSYPLNNTTHNNVAKSNEIRYSGKFSVSYLTFKDSETKSENSSWFTDINNSYYKKVKSTHYFHIRIQVLYLFFILFTVATILYYFWDYKKNEDKEKELVLNKDAFAFQCNLDKPDLFYNSIYVLIIFLLIFIGKITSRFEIIFKYVIYITYSSYVSIATGPLMNVNID
ncbi:hypothetical protein BCR36DRAFT_288750, partial [Piromyces finnis]